MSDWQTRLEEAERAKLDRKVMPDWVAPMLATLPDERFSSADWLDERKLDGERCLAFRDADGVRILSRNRKVLNDTYPELVAEIGFTEWTGAGQLRHPRFLGLRDDKPASAVHRERPET